VTDFDAVGEILAAADVPGLVAAAGRGPRTLATWTAGQADTTPGAARPMRQDTVFDLASLTKVVATTTVTLALAGDGRLGLDEPVARYLPAPWPVTIRQLLTHTSGLPASVKFYEWCADADQLWRELFATPLEAPPGTRVAYSDLGFMLLGRLAATVAGEPLDALFRRLVAVPLGLPDTGYLPDGAPAASGPAASAPAGGFAATERRPDGTPWTGIVHDENARLLGGVAGHAGLFATEADLATFAAWWVSSADGPVPAALRREAESCQTPGLDGRRGLGWTRIADRYDILGTAWPDSAVSHTGFTGTSLALDSPTGLWAILLTNAVHWGRDATAVKSLRREFHRLIAIAGVMAPPITIKRKPLAGVDRRYRRR
jgi:CubicO group peptidase (beta-lactamase class C family)